MKEQPKTNAYVKVEVVVLSPGNVATQVTSFGLTPLEMIGLLENGKNQILNTKPKNITNLGGN